MGKGMHPRRVEELAAGWWWLFAVLVAGVIVRWLLGVVGVLPAM